MKQTEKLMGALLGGVLLMGALPGAAAAKSPSAEPKMVVQVSDNDPAKWNLALNNIKNIQHDLNNKVVLELVAYGPGINMLKAESEVADRIGDAVGAGVKVVACQNTMKAQKLTPQDMNSKIGYVPSGAVEILEREQHGYSYLRP